MAGCGPCQRSGGKRAQKASVAVAVAVVLGVTSVALGVTLPLVLCRQDAGSTMAANSSARLEKALVVTNQSLAKARGQWEECKKQLGVLEGKASELEQALARVSQLQEENGALQAEVAQQQKQLKDLQSSRDKVQLQNQLLEKQLQDMRSQSSGGNRPPTASFSLLALLLPGMLLL